MAYNDDLAWEDVARDAQNVGRQVKNSLLAALEAYNEWQSFRAGRDNATIATALSVTTTQVAELDSCFAAGKECYDFATNVASPTAGDRFYAIRIFS